jgi:PAS domain S-box-containing protein
MKNSSFSTFDHVSQGAALHLFQDSVDPIILTDLSGIIVKANRRTFDLLGFSGDELNGSNITSLYKPGQILPDFSSLPDGSLQVFDGIMPAKQSQEYFHVQVHATRYALDGSDIVQWIHHDVTRQVELDQLRQDLAAMLVHDLQSPLGNVLSSLELVKVELPVNSSDTLRSMLDVAVRSSRHLQYLVESLMDISQLEAGYPISNCVLVNIVELIDYVYAVEEPSLEQRGVTPLRSISPGLPEIWAEESMLRRVLLNLLDNALKYSHTGQTITIKAQPGVDANMIRFSVIDQGQGIPEAYRDLIFEKFQRVRTGSSSSGLGLGLAFCRLVIEAHGGRIWVEDTPAGGACFSFTVPAAQDSASASASNPHN